jgi:hypothetical protein
VNFAGGLMENGKKGASLKTDPHPGKRRGWKEGFEKKTD